MKRQTISILLLAIILMQSCVAYQNSTVSIDQAFNKGRVRITTTQGNKVRFSEILIKDNNYYGLRGTKLTRLDNGQILAIQLQDMKKSKSQTIGLIAGVVIVGAVITFAILATIATVEMTYLMYGLLAAGI